MRLLLFLLVVVSGCRGSEPLAGDGVATSRRWPIEQVNRVVVSGPMSVQVLVGPAFEPELRVEGDSNVVAVLHRDVSNRSLTLDASSTAPSSPLSITITTPSLVSITAADRAVVTANAMRGGRLTVDAEGSARVLLNGVDGDSFVVNASRAATVDAAGSVRLVDVHASDVGTVSLSALVARVALVQATELSTVKVHATEALKGNATRSSRVVMTGTPALKSLVADDGSVVQSVPRSAVTAEQAPRRPGPG